MKVIGVVRREGNQWVLEAQGGERYELLQADMKDRMEGLTVRVVGTMADGFGLDMFDVPKQILVQHLKVV